MTTKELEIKSKSIINLFALPVVQNLQVHKLDIFVVYLNGELSETIFMELPLVKQHEKLDEKHFFIKKRACMVFTNLVESGTYALTIFLNELN